MIFSATNISYQQAGFSKIVSDYISADAQLRGFYAHEVSLNGIRDAIQGRKSFSTDRALLVNYLKQTYSGTNLSEKQEQNLVRLNETNCFTITTAHQPNIFTGPLYFVYKILHAIKLADYLNTQITDCSFVPVYFMGSEDADLDELGQVTVSGTKYRWATQQTGAVGRMIIDDELLKLLDNISGQLSVLAHGRQTIDLLCECYQKGLTVEQATFKFVNALFGQKGLLVFLPDHEMVKRPFIPIAEKELKQRFSHKIVEPTQRDLEKHYKVQAGGRELNLFYLADGIRERIEYDNGVWKVLNTSIQFDEAGLMNELQTHPEKFSPNVILRSIFQCMILPDVAFIGGGGELAYWLELKSLFENVQTPFPVLVLRNSFVILNNRTSALQNKLGLDDFQLFQNSQEQMKQITLSHSKLRLALGPELIQLEALYGQIKSLGAAIDSSLGEHTQALYVQASKKILALEKKMLRAEKRKMKDQESQLNSLRSTLFPNNGLQERVDNILPWLCDAGVGFLDTLYEHSGSLQQQFTLLRQKA